MVIALALLMVVGCWKDDMADDAHARPMESSTFFADGKLARPLINGTVPRGHKTVNDPMYAVTAATQPAAATFPFALTKEDLLRGREQYAIFCTPCHGALGDGNGMIVQRGFPKPPAFDLDRLKKSPPGHFYNVISHGYGAMYSYSDRIKHDDRWRIAGYVRVLQLTAGPTTQPMQPTTGPVK